MQGHAPQNKQASKKLFFCGNSVRNFKKLPSHHLQYDFEDTIRTYDCFS